MTHDYEAALEKLYADYSIGNYDGVTTADACFGEHSEAVHHALETMARMQRENLVMVPREPTEAMRLAGFQAMVQTIVSQNWSEEDLLKFPEEDREQYRDMDAYRAITNSDVSDAAYKAMIAATEPHLVPKNASSRQEKK